MAADSKVLFSTNFGPRMPGVLLLARDLRILSTQLIRVAKTVYKR